MIKYMHTFNNFLKNATENHMKKYIIGVAVILGILVGTHLTFAAIYPVQAQSFTLAGAGSSIGDATFTLSSMKDIDGNLLTMSMFGTIGFGTIEPGFGSQEESITFTGITQNSNGSATLTGVNSVMFYTPFTLVGNLTKSHPGASTFVLSNTSYFYYRQFGIVDNNSAITGFWTVPDPLSAQGIASRNYVDGKAFAGVGGATETATGTVQISTTAQAVAGVTNGSLGRLVLPSSLATSTWFITGANRIPVTDSNNKLGT